jgi:hypothetical protein
MMKIIKKLAFSSHILVSWSMDRVFSLFGKIKQPTHIIFCTVDHFEPSAKQASREVQEERMKLLFIEYPKLAEKHQDFYGNIPRRTWFFPPHDHLYGNLKKLVSLCEKGYGEIELHLHHGKICPDTSENLKMTLNKCVEEYSQFGIFGTANGQKKYGFIHGDWALDNSRGGKFCGVNDELQILNQTGCYADFTFPSMCEANPKQINSIYYATDNPYKPKSYNTGPRVQVNSEKKGDLMIIQGPVHPFFFDGKLTKLRTPNDSIDGNPPVTSNRVDYWIKTGIHVKGKPNWIFVKTHTHGTTDSKAVLGNEMELIFNHLESKYNDGEKFVLHYACAREMYNMVKACEAGLIEDNPELYRDYLIKKPIYDASPNIYEASGTLKEFVAKTYIG